MTLPLTNAHTCTCRFDIIFYYTYMCVCHIYIYAFMTSRMHKYEQPVATAALFGSELAATMQHISSEMI